MTPEELLKKRVKCIGVGGGHYPNSPFELGEIITEDSNGRFMCFEDWGKWEIHPECYPHLFKEISWHEDRLPEDMPEYVNIKDEKIIVKVDCYVSDIGFNFYYGESAGYGKRAFTENTFPATEKEYLNQNQ